MALSVGKDERVEGTTSFTITNDWLKKMYVHMWILRDLNRLVYASWIFRLRREYDGVVDANIFKIVRRPLLWWHVHNSFLVYVAFLFYLSTLDDCLTRGWLSNKVQSTNHRKLRSGQKVNVTYFVRQVIGSFDGLRLVYQTGPGCSN